jgi:hypothetical protein
VASHAWNWQTNLVHACFLLREQNLHSDLLDSKLLFGSQHAGPGHGDEYNAQVTTALYCTGGRVFPATGEVDAR